MPQPISPTPIKPTTGWVSAIASLLPLLQNLNRFRLPGWRAVCKPSSRAERLTREGEMKIAIPEIAGGTRRRSITGGRIEARGLGQATARLFAERWRAHAGHSRSGWRRRCGDGRIALGAEPCRRRLRCDRSRRLRGRRRQAVIATGSAAIDVPREQRRRSPRLSGCSRSTTPPMTGSWTSIHARRAAYDAGGRAAAGDRGQAAAARS